MTKKKSTKETSSIEKLDDILNPSTEFEDDIGSVIAIIKISVIKK